MKVSVIGLGGIATKAYLPLLAVEAGVELLLHSRRAETVDRLCAHYRLPPGTTDFAAVLRARPQAAFVLSPSETHFAVTKALLEAGIDVFLEKPATMSALETEALADLAAARGRVLMVGFNRRFAPLHTRARELWGERPVGLAVFSKHRGEAVHPELLPNYIDDTIHIVDLMRFYCGEARAVRTVFEMRAGKLVGAVSVVAFEKGGQGIIATNLDAGGWQENYALHGGQASLEIEAFTRVSLLAGGETRVTEENGGSWTPSLEARGFTREIAHFFDCVRTRREPLTSARDSARTQRLLEALVAVQERPAP